MRFICALMLLACSMRVQADDFLGFESGFCLSEAGLTTGYAHGNLRDGQGDYQVIPLAIFLAWDLNENFCWDNSWGNLFLVLEPFHNTIIQPKNGVETGASLKFRYLFRCGECLRPFLEGGAGPMYLGIDTLEQGNAGFNFLDEAGAGFRWELDSSRAITLGYRIRHISHARVRDASNGGINSHLGYLMLTALLY